MYYEGYNNKQTNKMVLYMYWLHVELHEWNRLTFFLLGLSCQNVTIIP